MRTLISRSGDNKVLPVSSGAVNEPVATPNPGPDPWAGIDARGAHTLVQKSAGADDVEPLCRVTHVKEGAVRSVERYAVQIPDHFRVPYSGAFAARFPKGLPLAITSGLSFQGFDDAGRWLFRSITDRGPNTESPKYRDAAGLHSTKVFIAPDYTPQIGTIRVRPGYRADFVEALTIKKDGKPISGRPIPPGEAGSTGELALSESLEPLPYDPHGLDPESIDIDRDGNAWIADEYGPFLVHVAPDGEILEKVAPGKGLPSSLSERAPNRGFEGCTIAPSGTVYAAIQSPREGDFVELVAYDPAKKESRMFRLRFDEANYLDLREAKIGDIAALDDGRLLVIEQGKDKSGVMQNYVSLVVLDDEHPERPAEMKRIVDLRAHGWSHEKAEALAIIDEHTIAIANDNDFGVKGLFASGDVPAALVLDANGSLTDAGGNSVERDYRLEAMPKDLAASELWVFRLARDTLRDVSSTEK